MIQSFEDRLSKVTEANIESALSVRDVSIVVSSCLTTALANASNIISAYKAQATLTPAKKSLSLSRVHSLLAESLDLALLTAGLHGEVLSLQEILDLVDEVSDDVKADVILSSCVISTGASEALLSYYDYDCESSEDFLDNLEELIAGICLVSTRLGFEFADVLKSDITVKTFQ